MSCKPRIGLNVDYVAASKDRPAYCVITAGYIDRILRAGGIPVLVPPLETDEDLDEVLDLLHGFLLIGGKDLDPRNDGYMIHPTVRPMSVRREKFDRRLARNICQRRMPVFGIGVGMQLLNITLGGTLFLHIPEDLPRAVPHKDPLDPNHRHSLVVEEETIMGRVFGDGEIRVNSMHHMAIDDVAPGFIVAARCPDGVIESIESRIDGWFAFGTQFHPEADSGSALDIRIFEEFVDGVRAHMLSGEPARLVA